MPHPEILRRNEAALVVVDLQEAFRHVIPDFSLVVSRVAVAIQAFQVLAVPVVITEQYPKGLGSTAEELKLVLAESSSTLEKTAFSACSVSAFSGNLDRSGVRQVVVCGVETHICVAQTALELLELGFQVHVLADCVSSRYEYNKLIGLKKMTRAGILESSIEMALFEMLGDSRDAKFKEIQALIR